MALHLLGKDPGSPDGGSPTIYYDDVTGTFLVQSWKVTDPVRLAQMDIPDHETVVELPRTMAQYFAEVSGEPSGDSQ